MPDLVKEVLAKEGFDIVKAVYRCYEVKIKELDLERAPSTSTNLGSGEALDANTQGVGKG